MADEEAKHSEPAFPQHVSLNAAGDVLCSYDFADGAGMSLRDWFAGQAPPMTEQWWKDSKGDGIHYLDALAAYAYAYADAMIAERAKDPAPGSGLPTTTKAKGLATPCRQRS